MPKNIEHIEVLHNDDDFGDFYSWSNKIVENNFGSNFKEGFPIVNFSKDGSEVEVITAYGELENGFSVLFDKDNLEWVVEFAKNFEQGGKILGNALLHTIDKKDENYDSIEYAIKGKKFTRQKVKIKDLVLRDADLEEYLNDNHAIKGRKVEKDIIVGDISRGGATIKGGVIDGFHRIEQAIANGDTEIYAFV
jgi:hypothetical protein